MTEEFDLELKALLRESKLLEVALIDTPVTPLTRQELVDALHVWTERANAEGLFALLTDRSFWPVWLAMKEHQDLLRVFVRQAASLRRQHRLWVERMLARATDPLYPQRDVALDLLQKAAASGDRESEHALETFNASEASSTTPRAAHPHERNR